MARRAAVSIIMAHYRREELLYRTLWGYRHTHTAEELDDVEFVIVDDDGGRSKTFWKVIRYHSRALKITAASMDEGTHNTSGPMNYGIKLATGGLFVLTNPENIPVVPSFIPRLRDLMNGRPNRYLSGACYSLDKNDTDQFAAPIESAQEFVAAISRIQVHERRFGNNGVHSGWRQHSKHFPGRLFFLAALFKKPLFKMRGFDEDYMKGQAREDVDFVHRIKRMKDMRFFHTDKLVVFHQYHFGPGCHKLLPERKEKVSINFATFKEKKDLPTSVRNESREWGVFKSAGRVEAWYEAEQLWERQEIELKGVGSNTEKYWDDLYKESKNTGCDLAELEKQGVLYRRVADEVTPGKVLDVACGLGPLLHVLGDEVDYHGIDFSEVALKQLAKEHVGLDGRLTKGDCTKLPYDSNHFDTVVLCEILEHLDDTDNTKALAEAWRVLKPGGKIIATVPCGNLSRHVSHLRYYYSYDANRILEPYDKSAESEFVVSWLLLKGTKHE